MADTRRLSMIRAYTPADLLTLANASCGMVAILLCLAWLEDDRTADLRGAFILPLVALACDALDGWVARRHRRQSALGADLDSLADVVSFGVAPAVLGYTLGLRGVWDMIALTLFVCAGISRLARFNVTAAALTETDTGKVSHFQGTPIPTSVVIVLLLALLHGLGLTGVEFWPGAIDLAGWTLHPFALLYLVSGSLMISTIRVPKP